MAEEKKTSEDTKKSTAFDSIKVFSIKISSLLDNFQITVNRLKKMAKKNYDNINDGIDDVIDFVKEREENEKNRIESDVRSAADLLDGIIALVKSMRIFVFYGYAPDFIELESNLASELGKEDIFQGKMKYVLSLKMGYLDPREELEGAEKLNLPPTPKDKSTE